MKITCKQANEIHYLYPVVKDNLLGYELAECAMYKYCCHDMKINVFRYYYWRGIPAYISNNLLTANLMLVSASDGHYLVEFSVSEVETENTVLNFFAFGKNVFLNFGDRMDNNPLEIDFLIDFYRANKQCVIDNGHTFEVKI